MRSFGIGGCCVLLALLLSGLSCTSCFVRNPRVPVDHPVTINNCTVTPKWFQARNPDTVTWTVTDANTYSIDFDHKTPLNPPLAVIPSMNSSQAVSKTLLGDSTCKNGIPSSSLGDCYFEYRLYENAGSNKTLCDDPGIHIVN